MLTRIEIDGFKTFERFSLDLEPMQVILGLNASGKSNLFDAIRLLLNLASSDVRSSVRDLRGEPVELFRIQADGSRSTRMAFAVELLLAPFVRDSWGETVEISHSRVRYEIEIELRQVALGLEQLVVVKEAAYPILSDKDKWFQGRKLSLQFQQAFLKYGHSFPWLTTVGTNGQRRFQIMPDASGVGRSQKATHAEQSVLSSITSAEYPHLYAIREEMRSWRFLQLDPYKLRRPSPTTAAFELEPDGANLATVLARIQTETATESQPKGVIADIAASLTSLIPGIVDLDVSLDKKNKEYQIEIGDRDGISFSSRVISDGTLRVLALLVLMYDPKHRGLVCFEEPENGVHPFRLKTLMERLREGVTDLTSQEVDETEPLSQMLLSSHSPVVLSCLEEGEALFADVVNVVKPETGTVSRKTRIRSVGTSQRRLCGSFK
ncbi:AAA family ATPase [Scytonema sp. UIC 10036]|uniref:AAA family ATPase n=1 Tax=Scytonema sp. UIC 10036 TaxID=2304196 RepID=UPI0012DAD0F1|nr:AAA family ATPase [Scytonema sp. UIC 10036]MUG99102.1 AAA family ATPase [Scytonema sp. UIC 10036]